MTRSSHLSYADDLIIFSETAEGLQHSLRLLKEYCNRWCLKVNMGKSKIIVFNKGGKTYKDHIFSYDGCVLEIVRSYPYLGIIISVSGSFNEAMESLKEKGMKSIHSLYDVVSKCNTGTSMKLFKTLVEPITNYGCEVWAPYLMTKLNDKNLYSLCEKSAAEKCAMKYGHICLQVHKKSANAAIRGELGMFPILIQQMRLAVKFLIHLFDMPAQTLVHQSLMECLKMNDEGCTNWLSGITQVVQQVNNSRPLNIGVITQVPKYENTVRDYLQKVYVSQWKAILNKKSSNGIAEGKLRTYNIIKSNFVFEKNI